MLHYFTGSFLVTILGLFTAYFWGEHVKPGIGLTCVFVAFVLAILEISLSFDNAVVNAMKLEKMSEKWRQRFITWGILIAVFGMRFLFPLLVVAIFAKLNIFTVLQIALNSPEKYKHYLELTHSPIVTFGGAFLLMLFLDYFTNKKNVCWLYKIERLLENLSNHKYICSIITFIIVAGVSVLQPNAIRLNTFVSGISGIIIYLLINQISNKLEENENKRLSNSDMIKCSGLIGFLYLELIDASFSLDGVLGAFALSTDIIIITIGLFIGAMFVRSLTIMLVEKKTLKQFIYLEHGAHWAIGALACLMFVSTLREVPEVITGSIGLGFIITSLISSLKQNQRGN